MSKTMRVLVQTCRCDGTAYQYEVDAGESVEDLKRRIGEQLNIPVHQLRLFFENSPVQRNAQRITVFIQTPTNKIIGIEVEPTARIEDVKLRLQQREGIPVDQQRFMFAQEPMHNQDMLFDYNIEDGSTLYLLL